MIKGLSKEQVAMVQHIKLLKQQAGSHSQVYLQLRSNCLL
jgi:hypothetical protein